MGTVKKSTGRSKQTTREKMMQRKKDLASKGNSGGLIFLKEGTLRVRLKSQGDDSELGIEIIQFYLGKDLGGIISPATFDEPCPFMEAYKKLKDSSKESDKNLAGQIVPKRRYVIGGIAYKDEKGKEIDPEKVNRGFLVTRSIYQDIIDLYLDEDEWGDMTDSDEGYDLKLTRSGSGKMDTTYSVSPCQKKPLGSKYQGTIDLEGIVRAQIKPYDELEDILNDFLGKVDTDEDDEDERPSKKSKSDAKSKASHKSFKKKVRKSDI